MQTLGVTPSENIEICLGLFCYENFLFNKAQIEKFEKDFNINLRNVIKVNIKEDLILTIKDEKGNLRDVNLPFNHLKEYMRTACNACDDFTNMYADISFGGLGSQNKFTTIIPRTEKGKKIFKNALDEGIFKCIEMNKEKEKKMLEHITNQANLKIKRYNDFMKNID